MTTLLDYAPPVAETEDWISRAEAATRIGVSMQTLDRYVTKGSIAKRQNPVTRRVRLSAEDVEKVRRERESV